MKMGKILIVFSLLAVFGFVIMLSSNIFENPERGPCVGPQCRRVPLLHLFLSPALLVAGIIPLSYYFISKRIEKKLEDNIKLVLKLVGGKEKPKEKDAESKNTIILKLLNVNERIVLEKLIEEKGKVLQSEISRMKGMNKLKAHRAIRS